MADSYRDTCRDCVHFVSWPERAEFAQRVLGRVPMGHPVHACMAYPDAVSAVSPGDSPANCASAAAGCTSFRRGRRNAYIKEVKDAG